MPDLTSTSHYDTDPRLKPRKVLSVRPDEDLPGLGWLMDLDCGHTIWCCIEPHQPTMYCGECLDTVVRELKVTQTR